MRIRAPREDEAATLAKLSSQLGYPATPEQVATRLAAIQLHEDEVILVAADENDEAIAWVHGFLANRLESDAFAEVGGLVVSAGRRGEGIGRGLLQAVESWAQSKGVNKIRIRSNVIRQRAHEFYLGSGYSRSKTSYVFDKSLR